MKSKTFNEFWQLFLQVTFHQGVPERWTNREKKALWCQEHLRLTPGAKVVDLGCGDGILDICLSRLGFEVTAIDRGQPVIENARKEDDTKKVQFIEQDLKDASLPNHSMDAVIMIETLGLLSKEEDLALLKKTHAWLKKGGRLLVDGPYKPSIKNDWTKDFPDGTVKAATSFDESTRIHQLNFEFHPKDGEPFNLYDPEGSSRDVGQGITRYIYTQEELQKMLQQAGFVADSVPHYFPENYYSLVGIK